MKLILEKNDLVVLLGKALGVELTVEMVEVQENPFSITVSGAQWRFAPNVTAPLSEMPTFPSSEDTRQIRDANSQEDERSVADVIRSAPPADPALLDPRARLQRFPADPDFDPATDFQSQAEAERLANKRNLSGASYNIPPYTDQEVK